MQTAHTAVFSPDASLVRLNNVTTDRQSQSAAAGRTGAAPFDPVEALEQVLQLIRLESRTGIIQAQHDRLIVCGQRQAHLPAFFDITATVFQQVVQELFQSLRVGIEDYFFSGLQVQFDTPFGQPATERLTRLAREHTEIDRFHLQVERAGIRQGQCLQIIDQARQVLNFFTQ